MLRQYFKIASAALALVPTGYESEWTPDVFCTWCLWREISNVSAANLNQVVKSVGRAHIELQSQMYEHICQHSQAE